MGLGGLGMGEIILIFLVVLLLFGAKRLPEIGGSLGKGIREFKGSIKDIEREIKTPGDTSPKRSIEAPRAEDQPVRERAVDTVDGEGETVSSEPRRLRTNDSD